MSRNDTAVVHVMPRLCTSGIARPPMPLRCDTRLLWPHFYVAPPRPLGRTTRWNGDHGAAGPAEDARTFYKHSSPGVCAHASVGTSVGTRWVRTSRRLRRRHVAAWTRAARKGWSRDHKLSAEGDAGRLIWLPPSRSNAVGVPSLAFLHGVRTARAASGSGARTLLAARAIASRRGAGPDLFSCRLFTSLSFLLSQYLHRVGAHVGTLPGCGTHLRAWRGRAWRGRAWRRRAWCGGSRCRGSGKRVGGHRRKGHREVRAEGELLRRRTGRS